MQIYFFVYSVLNVSIGPHLICKIQGLGDVVSNLNTLNRNMESIIMVGRDIERIADVWAGFNANVSATASAR